MKRLGKHQFLNNKKKTLKNHQSKDPFWRVLLSYFFLLFGVFFSKMREAWLTIVLVSRSLKNLEPQTKTPLIQEPSWNFQGVIQSVTNTRAKSVTKDVGTFLKLSSEKPNTYIQLQTRTVAFNSKSTLLPSYESDIEFGNATLKPLTLVH